MSVQRIAGAMEGEVWEGLNTCRMCTKFSMYLKRNGVLYSMEKLKSMNYRTLIKSNLDWVPFMNPWPYDHTAWDLDVKRLVDRVPG